MKASSLMGTIIIVPVVAFCMWPDGILSMEPYFFPIVLFVMFALHFGLCLNSGGLHYYYKITVGLCKQFVGFDASEALRNAHEVNHYRSMLYGSAIFSCFVQVLPLVYFFQENRESIGEVVTYSLSSIYVALTVDLFLIRTAMFRVQQALVKL
ncbi:hypothetical protein [Magnetococcus sp. PR-3]|uniref:hypothetical protein n=1 Tax=Magnetococcus sp. PR-3 TaxID=3120355 RepID=UPI002FCE2E77